MDKDSHPLLLYRMVAGPEVAPLVKAFQSSLNPHRKLYVVTKIRRRWQQIISYRIEFIKVLMS